MAEAQGRPGKDSLKSAANALFGKKTASDEAEPSPPQAPSPAEQAKAAADALFKKKV